MFTDLLEDRENRQDPRGLGSEETEAVAHLLQLLGGLPLGIRQSVALIKSKNWTVSKYLQRYNKEAGNTEKLIGRSHRDFTFDQDYGYALHNVWQMSFDALKEVRDAYNLLGILALLSPDSIPIELFMGKEVASSFLDFCYEDDGDRYVLNC